jgi:hypothetical protein
MPKLVDISRPENKNSVVVLEEHDDERQARIARENKEHAHKLWKDKIVFSLVVGSGIILFFICCYVLLARDDNVDPTSRDLAKIGITALFTGLVSFLAGQRFK